MFPLVPLKTNKNSTLNAGWTPVPTTPDRISKFMPRTQRPLLGLGVSWALVNFSSSLKPKESLLGLGKPCWFPPQVWGTVRIGSVARAVLDFSLSVVVILDGEGPD